MASGSQENPRNRERDSGRSGKIFVGGLSRNTTTEAYVEHFAKYGEMTDYVIMRDKLTNRPRGFGFVTFADPSVVDRVIEDTHIINGRQVEIKRTIPKTPCSKDVKTKKIFVGGLPKTLDGDELKDFFSQYGNVVDHQIIRDRRSNQSRGFGFVVFDSEQAVDELLSHGQRVKISGVEMEIKKAVPQKALNIRYSIRYDGGTFGGNLGGDKHGESFGNAAGGGGGVGAEYSIPEYGSGSGFGPVYGFGRGGLGRSSSDRRDPCAR